MVERRALALVETVLALALIAVVITAVVPFFRVNGMEARDAHSRAFLAEVDGVLLDAEVSPGEPASYGSAKDGFESMGADVVLLDRSVAREGGAWYVISKGGSFTICWLSDGDHGLGTDSSEGLAGSGVGL